MERGERGQVGDDDETGQEVNFLLVLDSKIEVG
jgi:hypothetical protein